MKLLIDADACPVVTIAVDICRAYGISCLLLCDTAHEFHKEGAYTLVFDKGADSVDFALVNRIDVGDIVVTQDYGVASMSLSKRARVLHQDGWEYTPENIDALLLARHESRKYRASGGRAKGPKKRTAAQDQAFEQALIRLIQTSVQG